MQIEAVTPTASARILDMSYTAFVIARAVYAATKLGVPDLLRDGERTSDELARATVTHPDALYRLLRALSSAGVVAEHAERRFALTPLGRALLSDVPGSMRAWVLFSGEAYSLRTWQDCVESVRTGKPVWEQVHGESFFATLRANTVAGSLFDEAMASICQGEAQAVVSAFDFAPFRKIADLGGGYGTLLAAILVAQQELNGVLFEQPHVAPRARERIASEGLAARCEVVAGDFFQTVPQGCDAYILKYILHDWDDERAVTLLEGCRKAMTDAARLLIVEAIVPPPGEPHYAKLHDLAMLVLLGSRERTVDEYAALLERARFKLERVVPTEETLSILEALPI
jgi:hypothetical protein